MYLNENVVLGAVKARRPIKDLFNSQISKLLDDYIVRDYVTNENIPEIVLNGRPAKLPASSFFEKYHHFDSMHLSEALKTHTAAFMNAKKFPVGFNVIFFDTFIVAEIMPGTLTTEFLIVSPREKGDDDILKGMIASIAILSLHSAMDDSRARLALFVRVDGLLEYLRTGIGRKK